MSVSFTPKMREYANRLIRILYEDEYFGTEEKARQYVDNLIYDIERNLPVKRHRPAPARYDKYGKGMKYASFRKNKRTTWYAFFKKYEGNGETIYLVRYIGNNHTEAHHLYKE
jgi:hypothetical protein